jgi:hypothetical protein
MNRIRISFLVAVLFAGALVFSQTPQWSKEAQKLQNSIRTLNTLIGINPFPEDVPGLNTAITNKTEQMMSDLTALDGALQSEMASLSSSERQEAETAYAGLMVQIADGGEMLALRSFDELTLDLVDTYNVSYSSYYSLASQYSLSTKGLPIGTTINERGGWIPQ